LSLSYLGQEKYQAAAEEFRRMALLDPDKAGAWFKLGHEYLDLAARLAYRGAHLYRESAWGHRFLGDLLLQRSRWEDASQEYRKALAIEPQQSGLHTSLGQAYLHAGKLEEAETEFQRELQLDSRNELAWLGLANLQVAEGQATAALASVGRVWEISPEFLVAQREFLSSELPQQAKASLSRVQHEPEGAAKHVLSAALYASTNESALSDRQWKLFQADFSAWQQAPNAVAGARLDQDPCKGHRYSRCVDSLRSRKHLTDSERLLLGKTQFTLQQYDAAAEALAQVQGATNENAEASYWLERTYQALGAEEYARLQASFPDSWRTHQLRAEGYALRQDVEDALKEYQVAVDLRPNESELHDALGELYLNHHADEDAQRELERALALDPSRTHALYVLGRLCVQKRDNEKALSYLQRALRLQPDLTEANGLLGTAYVRLGQFANAIPQLEKAAPLDHYGNVHYQLYLAYRKLGQAELAQKALARSQDLRRSSLERDQALILGSPQVEPEPQ
jgi:tetratricopeptide (TPR) repeat protein